MHYATLVQELDAREKRAEPFLGVRFGYFDSNEAGVIGPASDVTQVKSAFFKSTENGEVDLHGDKSV